MEPLRIQAGCADFGHLDLRRAFRRFKRREVDGWQLLVWKAEQAPRCSEVLDVRSSDLSAVCRRVSEGLISRLESQAVPAQAGSGPGAACQCQPQTVVSDMSANGGGTCSSSRRAVPISPMCTARLSALLYLK